MPKLSEKGAAHLLVPLILLLGIAAGVYLTVTGNLKLFSRASSASIVFKSSAGQALTNNSSGIPQTNSPTVKIELTSTLGAPVFATPAPSTVPAATPASDATLSASPIGVGTTGRTLGEATSAVQVSGTVSYKIAENPTDLDNASFVSYTQHPTTLDYTLKDTTPGTKFIWVEFKDVSGKVDRQSAQIEITDASTVQCNLCAADVNKDGGVNAFDVSALRSCYNRSAAGNGSDGKPCIGKDAFKDGLINGKDVSCIGTYMMQSAKSCQATPPPTTSPTPTPTPTPTPQVAKRIFVTSIRYGGNLVGLSGANAKCQESAHRLGVNLTGNWYAVLGNIGSDSSIGPIKLINGTLVADSLSDLRAGNLKHSINRTEYGYLVTPGKVWTGMNSGGSSSGANCNNWTSGSAYLSGSVGSSSFANTQWVYFTNQACSNFGALYCMGD